MADETMGARMPAAVRMRKLQDARLNIELNILSELDKIACIEHETNQIGETLIIPHR